MATTKRQTAAELDAELQSNPAYVEGMRRKREEHEREVAKNLADAEPIFAALARVGVDVTSFAELRRVGEYRAAIPVLLDWLPKVARRDVREDIVRTLSVPYARAAVRPLLALFTSTSDEQLRWAVGNALAILAADDIASEMLALARDRRWGTTRQMIVLGLERLHTDEAERLLLELLDDVDVQGHALQVLAKWKARVPRERLDAFLGHETTWIRRNAQKLVKHS